MLNSICKEIGKPVKNFEKLYEVSSKGRVSNFRKILKTYKINSGYLCLKLANSGMRTSVLVHRLVAEAFIPNPDNKAEVNHKDGNKENNCVENLEWVTSSENKRHALDTGIKVYNIPTKGKKLGNSSAFNNVTFDKARNKWKASVQHEGKQHYQRRFDNEIDAGKHVNWILNKLNLTDRPRNNI